MKDCMEELRKEIQKFRNLIVSKEAEPKRIYEEHIKGECQEIHAEICMISGNIIEFFDGEKVREFSGDVLDFNNVECALQIHCKETGRKTDVFDIQLLSYKEIENEEIAVYLYIYGTYEKIFSGCLPDRINRVYCTWVWNEFNRKRHYSEEGIGITEKAKRKMVGQVIIETNDYFEDILGIDLKFISEVSGLYYESKPCKSTMCFVLGQLDEDNLSIRFEDPVLVNRGFMKLIRKLLEMVREGQCLILERCSEGLEAEWCITGIANEKRIPEKFMDRLLFVRIVNHMDWIMEINKEIILCYERGRYLLKQDQLYVQKFKKKYEECFGMNCSENVLHIIKEAIVQKRGCALVFINKEMLEQLNINKCTGRGILRYYDAVGFGLKVGNSCELKNLSAIDGTILLDSEGDYIRFGMILNTEEIGGGDRARGSRYNSVFNYIKNCRELRIKAIGIVISEDGTIDIL